MKMCSASIAITKLPVKTTVPKNKNISLEVEKTYLQNII
jgi:hypothetical protein